ncbi:LysE family translocator [Streptomyces sp. NPDC058268]|uniref:LysE family translocator n=1 Tax=Streptomyces sp. NPDC058268 TaxID=3346413 RepID=UPI0036E5E312
MSMDLLGFFGVVLLAYLIPGPDFLVVVRAATRGRAEGRAAALGAQSGLVVHMAAAVLGLSVLAARSAAVFQTIKLLGAAYLVHLGVRSLINARRARCRVAETPPHERRVPSVIPSGGGASPDGRRRSFTQGFLTNVLNPKAALFFLSVLPQFVDTSSGTTTRQILLLAAADIAIGIVYWCALVAVAGRARVLLARPRIQRRWDIVSGWLFIGIGGAVATSA